VTESGSGRVAALIKKILTDRVEAAGFEVVRLHLPPTRRMRLMIDVPDGRVTLADCRRASTLAEEALHEVGHDPGSFSIEVESPGVDRPLTRERDFQRFKGERVMLTLNDARHTDGRRRFTGKLLGWNRGDVTLHVLDADAPETFRADAIEGVRLNPEPMFPSESHRRKRRSSGRHKKRGRKSGRNKKR
jgi:ribosome maturation factor RimP